MDTDTKLAKSRAEFHNIIQRCKGAGDYELAEVIEGMAGPAVELSVLANRPRAGATKAPDVPDYRGLYPLE